MPSRGELAHWWFVGSFFKPWQREFWLGLFHDTVEDGYLPRWLLRLWPSLDAITRRSGERYTDYIERVALDEAAARVKLVDIGHNMTRNGGAPTASLEARYARAANYLLNAPHSQEQP